MTFGWISGESSNNLRGVALMLTGSLRDIRVSNEPVDAVVKQNELVAYRYHLERDAAACSGAGRGAGVRTGHEALA